MTRYAAFISALLLAGCAAAQKPQVQQEAQAAPAAALADPSCLPTDLFTFPIATGDDDGEVYTAGSTYPPALPAFVLLRGAGIYPQRSFNGLAYTIGLGCFRWDTSALNGRQVQSAQFWSINGPNSSVAHLSQSGGWMPDGGPIAPADYTAGVYNSAFDNVVIDPEPPNPSVIPLKAAGSHVNTHGFTKICVTISDPLTTPTGLNRLQIDSYENGFGDAPRLLVCAPTAINYCPSGCIAR